LKRGHFFILEIRTIVLYNKLKQTSVLILKGGNIVKEQLIKAMQYHQLITIMYMSKSGEISKRQVKLLKISGDKFQAFCFLKHAKRTFIIDNVLAVLPVSYKEREVI
jgi:predicted DNA-binding transcriptional regulator YafY